MLEKHLVNQFIMFLKATGYFVWRQNNTPIFDRRKNLFRRMPTHTPRGIPDIVGMTKDGRFLSVEVKLPGGVQSDFQLQFEAETKRSGGIYILARSLEELEAKLKTAEADNA